MNSRFLLAAIALFSIGLTGCSGTSSTGTDPLAPPKIVEEYLDASSVTLATSFAGSSTWNYTVKTWGGVNQTITTEAIVAESNPEQVSVFVKRLTDNTADQIILIARELISTGTFRAGENAAVSVKKK